MKTIIAQKKEMTQIYAEDGNVIPVTLVDVKDVYVVGADIKQDNGNVSILLGKGKKKNATKAEQGKYKELGFVPNFVKQISQENSESKTGDEIKASLFTIGDIVKVTGTSKGKGFQGGVKRWNFHGGPKTHGQSDRWRAIGSIGSGTTPGRVYKGKKMPGRMGSDQVTLKNLKVVMVDEENGLLAIKGALPGNKGSYIVIQSN